MMSQLRATSVHGLESPVFRTTGMVVFDPDRGQMKRRVENWAVIEVDRGITAYYRWWLQQHWYEVDRGGIRRPVYQPSWDAHLSVVRGEASRRLSPVEVRNRWWQAKQRWDRVRVSVWYSSHIRQTGDTTQGDRPDHFWFIPAFAECVREIREFLTLATRDPTGKPYGSHITIGRTYD